MSLLLRCTKWDHNTSLKYPVDDQTNDTRKAAKSVISLIERVFMQQGRTRNELALHTLKVSN